MTTKTHRQSAFTLLEVMLAVLIIAVITGSLYAAFTATKRARRSAEASLDAARTIHHALQTAATDLAGAVRTEATTLELFVGENKGNRDTLAFHANTALSLVRYGQTDTVGSDVQFIRYELTGDGHLIRRTTRNLLSQTETALSDQTLAADVEAMNIRYHEGDDWLDEWDALLRDGALPEAVEITLDITRDGVRRRYLTVALISTAVAQTEQVIR